MSYFRKAVLSVNTYHSPDGTVVVTPERLKHWEASVKQIQATGYAIPMHWDHADADSIDLLEPIKLSALREGKTRSAKNTVGTLESFVVAPDGKSAELTVQTLTPSATEKAQSNAVYVSPVLFDHWKDGAGNVYTDVMGSVDLVDYPVDHSQGPFEPVEAVRLSCAIRMSASPRKLFRLSEQMPMEDDNMEPDGDEGAPMPTPAPQPQPSGARVADAIKGLAAMKVILPDDTTPENFLDRLVPALMTAAAQTAPEETEPEQLPPEPEPEKPVLADNPQIAAMSLRLKKFEEDKLAEGKKALSDRLQNLLASGRMTPAEHTEQVKRLGLTKMSLGDGEKLKATPIDIWVSAREAIPEGSCWTPDAKLKKLSTLKKTEPPTSWNTTPPNIEEALKQKRQMLRQPI